jgi:hypothetical protein
MKKYFTGLYKDKANRMQFYDAGNWYSRTWEGNFETKVKANRSMNYHVS